MFPLSADGITVARWFSNGDGGSNIYELVDSSWEQVGIPGASEALEHSGFNVSLSADGQTLAIRSQDRNNLTGIIRLHQWDGTDWSKEWV